MLEVKDLRLYYRTRRGPVRAVDGVSFRIEKGETMALVGESGCGKSSTAYAMLRVLPRNVHTYSGSVFINGEDTFQMDEEEFRANVRWKLISMVFQGAMNSLNPVLKVGDQLAEPLTLQGVEKGKALERVKESLKLVKLPEYIADRYPHELSGGMKQRAIIAQALLTSPQLVILDEPTSALDVVTQANIMNLLKDLKKELGIAYMLITHDLPLASEISDKIAVMYAGQIVEMGGAEEILLDPKHPYTQGLIGSVPTLRSEKELSYIPGAPPDLVEPPTGCRFNPRCPYVMSICKRSDPPMFKVGNSLVRCWLYG